MKLRERVAIALEIGESFYCEFKSAYEGPPEGKKPRDIKEIGYDIAKTLVAFANADGGILLVGVEDDNTVTGLPYSEDKLETIMKSSSIYVMQDTPLPLKRGTIVEYQPRLKVAFFSVEKGARHVHVTSKGECFQRKDRDSVPTAPDSIKFEREEQVSREYDRQFVDLANVTDLDIALVNEVSKMVAKSMSPEKFLQYLDLAEFDGIRLRLRRAGLLLFAKNVNKWHPRCQVRIFRVKGLEEKSGQAFNVTELAEINDNIFSLYPRTWEALRPHLSETRFAQDAVFKTQIIYPEDACREALINAITHRDYSMEGRGIEIRIFDDRLEVLSPGKLLSSLTIKDLEKLEGVHQTRNTYVARVLREYGYIRELGEGIRRMFDLMNKNELVPPKLESPNKSFVVALFYKQIYTREQRLWLENFASLNLTRDQRIVVSLGVDGRLLSRQEIYDQVGISDTADFQQLINSLQKLKILVTAIPKDRVYTVANAKKMRVKDLPRFQIVIPPRKPVFVPPVD